jgi:hypothetical protein
VNAKLTSLLTRLSVISESFIQTTDARTWYFVAGSALFAIANYVRFAKSTIWQM